MKKKIQIILLVLLIGHLCESSSEVRIKRDSDSREGIFTITGNKLIKPNKPYRVSIQYQGYESEKVIEVGIKNRNFEDSKNVELLGNGTKIVEFYVSRK